MNTELQTVILRNLLTNEEYTRKVLPFLERNYFEGSCQSVFHEIAKFVSKYNKLPTIEAFRVELEEGGRLSEEDHREALQMLPSIFTPVKENLDWLIETTEKWCQDRAVFNAVMESINIIDGKHPTLHKNGIPDILSKALAVTFDRNIGHDYLESGEARYDFQHEQQEKIPFDLEYLNKITKGGLPNKTLNVILAGPGVGKTMFMCHIAANALMQGRNVLYITMEMAEERIAERIDANLMNIPVDELENLSKDMFVDRVSKIRDGTSGKLIIKEYPTGQAHSSHFRALLNELKLKKNFIPEMIFIDYLNICASSRMKGLGGAINSYSYIKSIAEEFRGLAVEYNVPILSATQVNRDGFGNDDLGLENTSESFGLPATADLMFGLIVNDELNSMNKILVKQLKNRYNDLMRHGKFTVRVDRSRFKLSDDDEQDFDGISSDEMPVFENTKTSDRFKDFKME